MISAGQLEATLSLQIAPYLAALEKAVAEARAAESKLNINATINTAGGGGGLAAATQQTREYSEATKAALSDQARFAQGLFQSGATASEVSQAFRSMGLSANEAKAALAELGVAAEAESKAASAASGVARQETQANTSARQQNTAATQANTGSKQTNTDATQQSASSHQAHTNATKNNADATASLSRQLTLGAQSASYFGASLGPFPSLLSGISAGAFTAVSAIAALGVVLAAATAEAIAFSAEVQQSEARLQAWGNLSQDQANRVVTAMASSSASIFSVSERMNGLRAAIPVLESMGVSANDTATQLEFMKSAEDLAAVSGQKLETSSATLAEVMRTFKVEDATHAASVMEGVIQRTGVQLQQFADVAGRFQERLGSAAPTLEETAAVIDLLAVAGVRGQRGLASAESGLQTLTGGSKEARQELNLLQVQAYNSDGTMKPLYDTLIAISKAEEGMTLQQRETANAVIFGKASQEAWTGVLQQGPVALQAMIDKELAANNVHKDASTATNNLKDDLKKLVDQMGATASEAAGPFVKGMDDAVQALLRFWKASKRPDDAGGAGPAGIPNAATPNFFQGAGPLGLALLGPEIMQRVIQQIFGGGRSGASPTTTPIVGSDTANESASVRTERATSSGPVDNRTPDQRAAEQIEAAELILKAQKAERDGLVDVGAAYRKVAADIGKVTDDKLANEKRAAALLEQARTLEMEGVRQVRDATHAAIMDEISDKLFLAQAEHQIAAAGGSLNADQIANIRNSAQERQAASDKEKSAIQAAQSAYVDYVGMVSSLSKSLDDDFRNAESILGDASGKTESIYQTQLAAAQASIPQQLSLIVSTSQQILALKQQETVAMSDQDRKELEQRIAMLQVKQRSEKDSYDQSLRQAQEAEKKLSDLYKQEQSIFADSASSLISAGADENDPLVQFMQNRLQMAQQDDRALQNSNETTFQNIAGIQEQTSRDMAEAQKLAAADSDHAWDGFQSDYLDYLQGLVDQTGPATDTMGTSFANAATVAQNAWNAALGAIGAQITQTSLQIDQVSAHIPAGAAAGGSVVGPSGNLGSETMTNASEIINTFAQFGQQNGLSGSALQEFVTDILYAPMYESGGTLSPKTVQQIGPQPPGVSGYGGALGAFQFDPVGGHYALAKQLGLDPASLEGQLQVLLQGGYAGAALQAFQPGGGFGNARQVYGALEGVPPNATGNDPALYNQVAQIVSLLLGASGTLTPAAPVSGGGGGAGGGAPGGGGVHPGLIPVMSGADIFEAPPSPYALGSYPAEASIKQSISDWLTSTFNPKNLQPSGGDIPGPSQGWGETVQNLPSPFMPPDQNLWAGPDSAPFGWGEGNIRNIPNNPLEGTPDPGDKQQPFPILNGQTFDRRLMQANGEQAGEETGTAFGQGMTAAMAGIQEIANQFAEVPVDAATVKAPDMTQAGALYGDQFGQGYKENTAGIQTIATGQISALMNVLGGGVPTARQWGEAYPEEFAKGIRGNTAIIQKATEAAVLVMNQDLKNGVSDWGQIADDGAKAYTAVLTTAIIAGIKQQGEAIRQQTSLMHSALDEQRQSLDLVAQAASIDVPSAFAKLGTSSKESLTQIRDISQQSGQQLAASAATLSSQLVDLVQKRATTTDAIDRASLDNQIANIQQQLNYTKSATQEQIANARQASDALNTIWQSELSNWQKKESLKTQIARLVNDDVLDGKRTVTQSTVDADKRDAESARSTYQGRLQAQQQAIDKYNADLAAGNTSLLNWDQQQIQYFEAWAQAAGSHFDDAKGRYSQDLAAMQQMQQEFLSAWTAGLDLQSTIDSVTQDTIFEKHRDVTQATIAMDQQQFASAQSNYLQLLNAEAQANQRFQQDLTQGNQGALQEDQNRLTAIKAQAEQAGKAFDKSKQQGTADVQQLKDPQNDPEVQALQKQIDQLQVVKAQNDLNELGLNQQLAALQAQNGVLAAQLTLLRDQQQTSAAYLANTSAIANVTLQRDQAELALLNATSEAQQAKLAELKEQLDVLNSQNAVLQAQVQLQADLAVASDAYLSISTQLKTLAVQNDQVQIDLLNAMTAAQQGLLDAEKERLVVLNSQVAVLSAQATFLTDQVLASDAYLNTSTQLKALAVERDQAEVSLLQQQNQVAQVQLTILKQQLDAEQAKLAVLDAELKLSQDQTKASSQFLALTAQLNQLHVAQDALAVVGRHNTALDNAVTMLEAQQKLLISQNTAENTSLEAQKSIEQVQIDQLQLQQAQTNLLTVAVTQEQSLITALDQQIALLQAQQQLIVAQGTLAGDEISRLLAQYKVQTDQYNVLIAQQSVVTSTVARLTQQAEVLDHQIAQLQAQQKLMQDQTTLAGDTLSKEQAKAKVQNDQLTLQTAQAGVITKQQATLTLQVAAYDRQLAQLGDQQKIQTDQNTLALQQLTQQEAIAKVQADQLQLQQAQVTAQDAITSGVNATLAQLQAELALRQAIVKVQQTVTPATTGGSTGSFGSTPTQTTTATSQYPLGSQYNPLPSSVVPSTQYQSTFPQYGDLITSGTYKGWVIQKQQITVNIGGKTITEAVIENLATQQTLDVQIA